MGYLNVAADVPVMVFFESELRPKTPVKKGQELAPRSFCPGFWLQIVTCCSQVATEIHGPSEILNVF